MQSSKKPEFSIKKLEGKLKEVRDNLTNCKEYML
jgi:hypothetical protein